MIIEKYHRIIISVCMAVILINVVVLSFIFGKQGKSIHAIQKAILAEQRKPVAGKDEREKDLNAWVKTDMNRAVERIPHIFSLTRQAGQIVSLTDRNHLFSLKGMVFRPEKNDHPFLINYSTTMTLRGEYSGLKGFIADIQNLPALVFMDELNFTRTSDRALTLKLKISLYFRGDSDG
jgi:Tfp pilus assembly protein PilO